MRWILLAWLIVFSLASIGCMQTAPANPSPTASPSIEPVIAEPTRTHPLSVRLGDTIEVQYTMSVGAVVVETTEKAVAVQAGIPDVELKNFTPLRFIVGYNDVIPSIEKTVQGMTAGENKVVQVPPQNGFGMPKAELIKTVPRESFGDANLSVGYLVFGPDQKPIGKVVALNETDVVVDTNHPLAGKTLTLNITVLTIEPPRKI